MFEPTLLGEQAEFDTENEDEYLLTLQDHSDRIGELEESTDDHELRITHEEEDIDARRLKDQGLFNRLSIKRKEI